MTLETATLIWLAAVAAHGLWVVALTAEYFSIRREIDRDLGWREGGRR